MYKIFIVSMPSAHCPGMKCVMASRRFEDSSGKHGFSVNYFNYSESLRNDDETDNFYS